MELPKPPPDHELRTIIDKLAQFVARNGPEFEQMTKNKQKGNPRFSFLFGGEYFNYYQYKVTTEQAILKQKEVREPPMSMAPTANLQQPPPQINANNLGNMLLSAMQGGGQNAPNMNDPVQAQVAQWFAQTQPQQQPPPAGTGGSGPPPSALPPLHGPPPSHPPPPNATIEALNQQQAALQEQITQSEQNLNAQHMVLMQQQDSQIEQEIRKKEMDGICLDAEELGINLNEFDSILHPIIDSCTKDSISNGKAWILQRATSKKVNSLMARYLLSKLLEPDKKFIHKLHIIYLVNDILHHCVRKHTEDFKIALEDVVVPMFCNASLGVNEEQQVKLSKLLVIWETKNHYFPGDIVRQLKDPTNSWERYKQQRLANYSDVIEHIVANTKNAVSNFQSQHMAFVSHAHRQIQIIEQQKMQLMEAQQKACAVATVVTSAPPPPSNVIHQEPPPPNVSQPPPQQQLPPPPPARQRELDQPPPALDLPININQPPPGFGFPPVIELPDLTRPPPGFAPVQPEVILEDLLPSLPYYDLPAGLMVPLIKLEDFSYKALDPDAIRLPPPAPPSERLIAAVKAFYMPPRHEQPRDCDGWEKLGLYEYFRAKASARKQKEIEIEQGIRERSRSPTPVRSFQELAKSPPPKRRYSSRSRSRSPRDRDRDKDKDKDKDKEKEKDKERDRGSTESRGSGGKSSRRSRRDRSNERRDSRADREDSNSREALNRSPTPPSFLGVGSSYSTAAEDRLSEANKGHQMLRKMGWAGAGLGAKEQGIEQPIPGGDVRDKTDQYKGVGINLNDPYENFRKSKGQAFITRMKARAEERAT